MTLVKLYLPGGGGSCLVVVELIVVKPLFNKTSAGANGSLAWFFTIPVIEPAQSESAQSLKPSQYCGLVAEHEFGRVNGYHPIIQNKD